MGNVIVSNITRTPVESGSNWGSVAAVPSGDWKLGAGNYVSGKLTGRAISPRPDTETDANGAVAYYRNNHSEMDYKVRICVKGMAWPFKYAITADSTGSATIGGELDRSTDAGTGKTLHTWGADYAVLTVAKADMPSSGTSSFTVTVTDQDDTVLPISWTTTRDDSKFVFIDAGASGNDAAAGTFAAPLKTFQNGLWNASNANSEFAGKQAVFMAGTYPIFESATPSNVQLTSSKPMTYRSFNDAAVTFDTSNGHFGTSGGADDLSVLGNITIDGSRTDISTRIFYLEGFESRQLWWGLTFINTGDPLGSGSNGSNPACIHLINLNDPHSGTGHYEQAVVDCTLASTVNVPLWVGYAPFNSILENNVADNVSLLSDNGGQFIDVKDGCIEISVRANRFIGASNASAAIRVANQSWQTLPLTTDQEVCWNTLYNSAGWGVRWNEYTGSGDNVPNENDYRNSVISSAVAYSFGDDYGDTGTAGPEVIGNAMHGGSYDIDPNRTNFHESAPISARLSASDFDAAGKLTGTARTNYLGTHGSEVAS